MRCSTVLVALAAAAVASATTLHSFAARQSIPNCAVPCLTSAPMGSCSQTDDTCLCHNSDFINGATSCIESSCSGDDLKNAEAAAQALCAAVGVTLTATPTASSSSGASTATSPASSVTTASGSSTASLTSGSPSSTSTSGASANGIPALAGLAALGLAALAL
ncbi:hypothetical protein PUNSTDRAFT_118091 [Punctularia strigosozonata HHB-11173 SS5]|uniref:uncharacterized protein n=1 Tax=Punctularia strigosozonata (strain HHB-11173) TaxID=741275 RepID=UPI0004416F72|nr:uncharacterized protein PUNSTDRAFT_118091 [Punctularia strigosozonata HHB-11173 SS5]EIN14671.1 hypothetical protein PUNSTDRAFT_118091 [Punctularia strigosozonata HHB-11173 SS5]